MIVVIGLGLVRPSDWDAMRGPMSEVRRATQASRNEAARPSRRAQSPGY